MNEFLGFSEEYYRKAIEDGRILVNNKKVELDYILKMNDKIEHKAEKREPGVFDFKLVKVYEDDDYLVIDKPPSIPVHICGNYVYNSIINILRF